jgi:hypothetical protein
MTKREQNQAVRILGKAIELIRKGWSKGASARGHRGARGLGHRQAVPAVVGRSCRPGTSLILAPRLSSVRP